MDYLWFRLLSLLNLPTKRIALEKSLVPKVILGKFNSHCALSYNVHWFLYKGIYEVSFYLNGSHRRTLFDNSGNIVREFKSIKISKLPKETVKNMIGDMGGYRIDDVLWDEFHQEPHFRVMLKKGRNIIEAEYDNTGHILASQLMDK